MRRISIASLVVFLGFSCGLVVACSGSQPKTDPSALTLEEFEENSADAAEPPPDPMDNPTEHSADECATECRSDDDCCEGYFCGKDPEKSQRRTYCMPGG